MRLRFGAEESRKILSVLIDARRVTVNQARAALKRFHHTVAELKSRLAALESGAVAAGLRRTRARVTRKTRVTRRPKKASAQRKKAMRDQGRYLAAIRPLAKGDRARIKAIREKSGVRAAIAAAKRMAR